MITEDYVSFETAKLLKENGFDGEDCFAFYKENGEMGFLQTFGDITDFYSETCIYAPTLQMAMKWLREVHKIHITMTVENNGNYIGYIYRTTGANIQGWDRRLSKTSYEEAAETVIKYCLENLI